MSDLGCLLLPLAWYTHPIVIVSASVILFMGGTGISYYYHIRGVDVNEYVFKFGQPIFIIAYGLVLWKLSFPLITIPIGIVLFVVIIAAIQLFRKYILGLSECCRRDDVQK
jgi:hypothetical protein